jgi:hypothetical protein
MGLSTLYEFPFGIQTNPWLAVARINAETVYLLTNRAKAYLDLSKSLGACQTSDDFLTQQVTFWQVAQRQYMDSFQSAAFAALPEASSEANEPSSQIVRSRDYMVVAEPDALAVKAAKDAVLSKQANPERLRRSA